MLRATAVTPQETAYLVLRYLQDNQFISAATQFAAEAEGLLRHIVPPAANQKVKGLHTLLCEYVALDARARQREAFERAFGDDGDVRSCLSRLGCVMDDYMALRNSRNSASSVSSTWPASVAPAAAALAPRRPEERPGTSAPERSGSRKRKSVPRRRLQNGSSSGVDGPLNSRQLFGQARSSPSYLSSPWQGARGGTSSAGGSRSWPPLGAPSDIDHSSLPDVNEQLGEAIAKRINTGVGMAGTGRATSLGGGSWEKGMATTRDAGNTGRPPSGRIAVDEMSVDEIVQSLLADPHATAMLSTFSRPHPGLNATQCSAASPQEVQSTGAIACGAEAKPTACGTTCSHAAQTASTSVDKERQAASSTDVTSIVTMATSDNDESISATQPVGTGAAGGTKRPADEVAAAFPKDRVNIDSFLSKLHGGRS